jgi:hypothetical protein
MQFAIFAGLGNQLFQFTAAHLSLNRDNEKITLVIDQSPQVDRPFLLAPIIENCPHEINCRVSEIRETKGRGRIMKVFSLKCLKPIQKILQLLPITYETTPYVFNLLQFQVSKLNVGYYQHWQYPESAWLEIGPEITDSLRNVSLSEDILDEVRDSIVIHIRRGDLLNSMETMGLLSRDYYAKAINSLVLEGASNEIIAFTDDTEGSTDLSQQLNVKRLFGPEDVNQFEALAYMSHSNRLVVANSTFSWWAGFLATKNNASVVVPDPWFKKWHQEIGNAFIHPQMRTIESSFL